MELIESVIHIRHGTSLKHLLQPVNNLKITTSRVIQVSLDIRKLNEKLTNKNEILFLSLYGGI